MSHHVFNSVKTHPSFSSTAPRACPWPKLPLCDERNPWNWKLHEVPTYFGPCQWDFQANLMGVPVGDATAYWNRLSHATPVPFLVRSASSPTRHPGKGKLQVLQQCMKFVAPQGQNPSEFSSLPRHLSRGWVKDLPMVSENSRPRLGWSHPRVRIISWDKKTPTSKNKQSSTQKNRNEKPKQT